MKLLKLVMILVIFTFIANVFILNAEDEKTRLEKKGKISFVVKDDECINLSIQQGTSSWKKASVTITNVTNELSFSINMHNRFSNELFLCIEPCVVFDDPPSVFCYDDKDKKSVVFTSCDFVPIMGNVKYTYLLQSYGEEAYDCNEAEIKYSLKLFYSTEKNKVPDEGTLILPRNAKKITVKQLVNIKYYFLGDKSEYNNKVELNITAILPTPAPATEEPTTLE